MKNIKLFYLFLFPLYLSAQLKQIDPKAINLRDRAIILPATYLGVVSESHEQYQKSMRIKMLALLDSAIKIEPAYYAAYLNKLASLVYLKKYNEALRSVNFVIKSGNMKYLFAAYINRGVIYQDYFKQKEKATDSYNKAYLLMLEKSKKEPYKNPAYDEKVAYALLFLKGNNAALSYLNNIGYHYKNPKTFDSMKVLLKEPLNVKKRFGVLDSYTIY